MEKDISILTVAKGTAEIASCEPSGSKPIATDLQIHVLGIESKSGFPEGQATAARLRMVGRALVEAKAHVTFLFPKPSEEPNSTVNYAARGTYLGIDFEYTCGTCVRSPSFWVRRFLAFRGWVLLMYRIVKHRIEVRHKGSFCIYLYAESPHLCLPVFLLAKIFRFPVVIELSEWMPAVKQYNWFLRWHNGERIVLADGVLSISSYLNHKALSLRSGRDAASVLELSSLVDLEEYAAGSAAFEQSAAPYLLWCGQIDGYLESVKFLIRSFAQARCERPDLRFMIVGRLDDDIRSRVLEFVRTIVPDESVVLTGFISREHLRFLCLHSTALLAPLEDDVRSTARFPVKIAEYLVSGRPVITAAVGEVLRYLRDGENAFVYPPNNEAACASRMLLAVKDPQLADRVGAHGRDLARACFDYRLQGKRIITFIRSLTDSIK